MSAGWACLAGPERNPSHSSCSSPLSLHTCKPSYWVSASVSKVLAYLLQFRCLPAGTAPFKVVVVLLLWWEQWVCAWWSLSGHLTPHVQVSMSWHIGSPFSELPAHRGLPQSSSHTTHCVVWRLVVGTGLMANHSTASTRRKFLTADLGRPPE